MNTNKNILLGLTKTKKHHLENSQLFNRCQTESLFESVFKILTGERGFFE